MKKFSKSILILALIIVVGLPGSLFAQKTFDETLEVHLNAIRNSNLAEFEPTIADSITHIEPYGKKNTGKINFLKVHEDWFKLKHWEWNGKIIEKHTTESLGYALIDYTFILKDDAGKTTFNIHAYLTLIFRLIDKKWQLVFDQSTPIPAKP